MKLDAALLATDPTTVAAEARSLEALGYDGTFTFEGPHDPFFPLAFAAEHTTRLEIATAVAIATPRSPMQLAHTAHDLNVLSGGRFILGLGSQIRAHVEKRYGATWSRPLARMREFVLALRAIWRCWNENAPLDFRGELYRHTLMTPFFNPGASPYGPPRVFLGGVGPAMTTVVGEVADGLFVHPMHSPEFVRTVTLPALDAGLAKSGRTRTDLAIACQALVITGFDEAAYQHAETTTRMQLAFYASTPQYRVVLDTHGWGDAQPELHRLAREGRWLEMAELVDDAMLAAFTVRCERPADVPAALRARYDAVADRVAILCHSDPHRARPEAWAEVLAAFRSGGE
jgi:probable F420-dependent oxidoreductase